MFKLFKPDVIDISFIPSFGAPNCINICNILQGWGCKFIALFDYDKGGVESGGEKMNKNFHYELGKQYIYLKDVNQDLISTKDYNDNPYEIENLIGKDILSNFIEERALSKDLLVNSKSLLAKMFCEALRDGSYIINDECKNKFDSLFNRILEAR